MGPEGKSSELTAPDWRGKLDVVHGGHMAKTWPVPDSPIVGRATLDRFVAQKIPLSKTATSGGEMPVL
jgi:hypothetical protein